MKYLKQQTRKDADAISHRIALEQGAGTPQHVTQFWFSIDESDDGEALLTIPDGQEKLLNADEERALVEVRPSKFDPPEDAFDRLEELPGNEAEK
jgi:hypothetical protein